jgi:hypothetical protein
MLCALPAAAGLCCRQFADAFVSKLPLVAMNLTSQGLVKQ